MIFVLCKLSPQSIVIQRHKFSPPQSKSWSILIFIYPNIKAFFKSLHSSKPYLGPSHFTFVVTFYLPRAAVKTFTTIIFTGLILIIVSSDLYTQKLKFFSSSKVRSLSRWEGSRTWEKQGAPPMLNLHFPPSPPLLHNSNTLDVERSPGRVSKADGN